MPTDYSKLTDAEVYERCAKALGLDNPRYDGYGRLNHFERIALFARVDVLDAMVERGYAINIAKHCALPVFLVQFAASLDGVVNNSLDRAICVAALLALEAEDAR